MSKNQIAGETEYILSMAIAKCGDLSDAQDITQETMLSALVYLDQGGVIDNPRAFLATLLTRKYYDMLRRKYRLPTITIGEDFDIADPTDLTETSTRREEAELIRRELVYLAGSYRSVIVKHYFHNKSVKEIAAELGLPAGTVKSRLDFGRKQLRKGIEHMEKYQETSYLPQKLILRNSGISGMDGEPFSLTEGDLLAQNLLILAYEKPITVSDLSRAIGVAAAYTEPVIQKLVDGELMKRMGDGKVYTDFIIYHATDFVTYIHEEEAFVEKHIQAYTKPLEDAIRQLRQTPFYSERLERFMMIQIAESGLYECMERIRERKQIFPLRPNGGQWIAFATIYPENYKVPEDKRGKEEYMLSGRRCTAIDSYLNAVNLRLYNYETSLDPASHEKHRGYGFPLFQDVELNMLKLFYLIQKGINPDEAGLDTRMIQAIPLLEERGFITTKNGTPELLIPVLSHEEEKQFFEICENAWHVFGDQIREPLAAWCKTHRKDVPAHLTDVPDQKRTMPYEPNAMMFVYAAIHAGMHPRNPGSACPETIAVFD